MPIGKSIASPGTNWRIEMMNINMQRSMITAVIHDTNDPYDQGGRKFLMVRNACDLDGRFERISNIRILKKYTSQKHRI